MREVVIKILGEVQGVGFRYQTQRKAQELNLGGFVRNAPDGSLEIVAQGDKENLEKFLAWTKAGPQFAQVEKVEASWREPTENYPDFAIV
mgnify:CR=1 FL=1